jgi:chromatin segregation and condensation protein Rec8/ScpA/Scc1 (kleisin family)
MEINGIDNIKSTFKIVKAINDFISKKKKELPYNINVIDELHANENAHSRILCKLLQYKDSSDKYRILESLLSYISLLEGKEKFSEVFIKSP